MSRPRQPCGTPAAWRRHHRHGEDPCTACKLAHRAYQRHHMQRARTQYPMGECAGCSRRRPIQRYGWCEACVTRWQDAGRPDTGPPPLDLAAVRQARQRGAAKARAIGQQIAELRDAVQRGGWGWLAS